MMRLAEAVASASTDTLSGKCFGMPKCAQEEFSRRHQRQSEPIGMTIPRVAQWRKSEEILSKLNDQEKAWLLIGPKKHGYTVEDMQQRLRTKTGEDIIPASIAEYGRKNGVAITYAADVKTPSGEQDKSTDDTLTTFLQDGQAIRKQILRRFHTEKGRRVALVAFVGKSAEAYLPRPKGIELYCWPHAPGTKPAAIHILQKLKANIRLVNRLHMKVY